MAGTVYADILFLIDFSMDFLCFYIVFNLSHRPMKLARTVLASSVGGVYSVASLFIRRGGTAFITDAAALFLMCAVADTEKRKNPSALRSVVSLCAGFAAVSALLGGMMTALFSLINRSGIRAAAVPEAETAADDVSVWTLALLAAVGSAAAMAGGRRLFRDISLKKADVVIVYRGREVTLRGFCDTGNMLTDPVSGRAVLVCELDSVKNLFPEELVKFWYGGRISDTCTLSDESCALLRFIPVSGALTHSGEIITAVNADKVELRDENGKNVAADLLVAPINRRLGADGCAAIFPPGIL